MKRFLTKIKEEETQLVGEKQLTYNELYNQLVTEITRIPLLFLKLKAVYRLVEAERRNKESLDEVYNNLDNEFNGILDILAQLRDKEGEAVFVAHHGDPQTIINNSENFAVFYRERKAEADESIANSQTILKQIKTEIINRIPKRNQEKRKRNTYYDDLIGIRQELSHIHNVITKKADRIDKQFGTNILEGINNE
jgi:hypothetical protein